MLQRRLAFQLLNEMAMPMQALIEAMPGTGVAGVGLHHAPKRQRAPGRDELTSGVEK